MSFADNLNALPKVGNIRSIELSTAHGTVVAAIENRPGQAGSVAVYSYLIGKYGCIDGRAAVKGLKLYAEHAADARANPGKHPNIDRLLAIEGGGAALLGKFNFVDFSAQ
jgi:hypothetical protein